MYTAINKKGIKVSIKGDIEQELQCPYCKRRVQISKTKTGLIRFKHCNTSCTDEYKIGHITPWEQFIRASLPVSKQDVVITNKTTKESHLADYSYKGNVLIIRELIYSPALDKMYSFYYNAGYEVSLLTKLIIETDNKHLTEDESILLAIKPSRTFKCYNIENKKLSLYVMVKNVKDKHIPCIVNIIKTNNEYKIYKWYTLQEFFNILRSKSSNTQHTSYAHKYNVSPTFKPCIESNNACIVVQGKFHSGKSTSITERICYDYSCGKLNNNYIVLVRDAYACAFLFNKIKDKAKYQSELYSDLCERHINFNIVAPIDSLYSEILSYAHRRNPKYKFPKLLSFNSAMNLFYKFYTTTINKKIRYEDCCKLYRIIYHIKDGMFLDDVKKEPFCLYKKYELEDILYRFNNFLAYQDFMDKSDIAAFIYELLISDNSILKFITSKYEYLYIDDIQHMSLATIKILALMKAAGTKLYLTVDEHNASCYPSYFNLEEYLQILNVPYNTVIHLRESDNTLKTIYNLSDAIYNFNDKSTIKFESSNCVKLKMCNTLINSCVDIFEELDNLNKSDKIGIVCANPDFIYLISLYLTRFNISHNVDETPDWSLFQLDVIKDMINVLNCMRNPYDYNAFVSMILKCGYFINIKELHVCYDNAPYHKTMIDIFCEEFSKYPNLYNLICNLEELKYKIANSSPSSVIQYYYSNMYKYSLSKDIDFIAVQLLSNILEYVDVDSIEDISKISNVIQYGLDSTEDSNITITIANPECTYKKFDKVIYVDIYSEYYEDILNECSKMNNYSAPVQYNYNKLYNVLSMVGKDLIILQGNGKYQSKTSNTLRKLLKYEE